MVKKCFFLVIALALATVSMCKQPTYTDEELLAQTLLKELSAINEPVYIVSGMPYTLLNNAESKDWLHNQLCKELQLCDTNITEELYTYGKKVKATGWDKNAPIFQQQEYKKLVFLENGEETDRLIRENKPILHVSKPLYTKNQEYALALVVYYSSSSYIHEGKTHYAINLSGYNVLFKRINGEWKEQGRFLSMIS